MTTMCAKTIVARNNVAKVLDGAFSKVLSIEEEGKGILFRLSDGLIYIMPRCLPLPRAAKEKKELSIL